MSSLNLPATLPSHQLHEGQTLTGDSNTDYLLVAPLGQPNVWTAVDSATQSSVYIIKQPAADDPAEAAWPNFQQEMVMHKLFEDDPSIRQQVDQIAPTRSGAPPRMVLEIFEGTVWDARAKRPLSMGEIKSIMRDTLEGLVAVHEKGLVYADLKMQNILVSGFDATSTSTTEESDSSLTTKLGDLGIVMEPAKGVVQPLTYRAPEVYFKHSITPAADIWSWGLLVCHLLEARSCRPLATQGPTPVARPSPSPTSSSQASAANLKPPPSLQKSNSTDSAASASSTELPTPNGTNFTGRGLYDDLYAGGRKTQQEQSIRHALANDYDLASIPYYADCTLPVRDREHQSGRQWVHLREKGVQEEDVEFLKWVLDPSPETRPTAGEILGSSWFHRGEGAVQEKAIDSRNENATEQGKVQEQKQEQEEGQDDVVEGSSQKRKLSTYLDYGFGAVKRAVGAGKE